MVPMWIRWTGLAPWEFEFPFPGSLISTFLVMGGTHVVVVVEPVPVPSRTHTQTHTLHPFQESLPAVN